jgi:hypothetical protein
MILLLLFVCFLDNFGILYILLVCCGEHVFIVTISLTEVNALNQLHREEEYHGNAQKDVYEIFDEVGIEEYQCSNNQEEYRRIIVVTTNDGHLAQLQQTAQLHAARQEDGDA